MISPELVALAEDPEAFTEPVEGSSRVELEHACVVIGPERRWAGVSRVRLPAAADSMRRSFDSIRELVAGVPNVFWNVGSSATPETVVAQLRAWGLKDPDPPWEPVVAGMAIGSTPPDTGAVEVRRIDTLEDHRAGLEILLAAAEWTEEAAAGERARSAAVFERRQRQGSLQWLALLSGKPVSYGSAERADAGLYISGGSTLPEARGQGCYRALVRARWDEAVRLGTPGLATQAQFSTSAPILRRLGFAEVATITTLQ